MSVDQQTEANVENESNENQISQLSSAFSSLDAQLSDKNVPVPKSEIEESEDTEIEIDFEALAADMTDLYMSYEGDHTQLSKIIDHTLEVADTLKCSYALATLAIKTCTPKVRGTHLLDAAITLASTVLQNYEDPFQHLACPEMFNENQTKEKEPLPQQSTSNQPSTSKISIKRKLNFTHHLVAQPKMPRTESHDNTEMNSTIEIPETIKTQNVQYDQIIARNHAFKDITKNLEVTSTTTGRSTDNDKGSHCSVSGGSQYQSMTHTKDMTICEKKTLSNKTINTIILIS